MRRFPVFNAFTAVIKGSVQGVGFRYFTKGKADELHLTGWVRNRPDGTVELLAKGDRTDLEQFMQSLIAGSTGSWVEKVEHQWTEESQDYKGFEIRG